MTITLSGLVRHLEKTLQPGRFADYCPNGLQVEGSASVAPPEEECLACLGTLATTQPVSDILALLERETGRTPLYIGSGSEGLVSRVAWCTGTGCPPGRTVFC